ncbi:dynein light chain 1, cytoplasmic [Dioscorea cayenensis subsp. rotundata]|uniref:Dynein light chain n=1 Tax=Dioscorea cayennensis subsp. rotundata TaxID=55577 RepID=A0AB40BLR7_DIOCR|nr:dynein light chain 1, cytoplasmic [Dioscorea cayenensis subsp. rotundata]
MRDNMDTASEELERRSKYLSSLIQKTKIKSDGVEEEKREKDGKDNHQPEQQQQQQQQKQPVRVRAADMAPALQRRAFRCAREVLASMPKLDSKRLALALKKEFDTSYGPAWHCIVGTSFGSYVTHSLGGFLYFSIDKVYILLFRTAVEPLDH